VRVIPSDSWKSCRWPGEKENQEAFSNLIFALERYTLPDNLAHLASEDELANYAFQMGTSWKTSLADNAAPWLQKPAIYPGLATCLTSGSSTISSSRQRHAPGLVQNQAAGNFSYQTNQVHINVTAMQAGTPQDVPFQSFDTAPEPGHNNQPERQHPTTPRPLRTPQKPKGLFGPVKNLIRGKSNASRSQGVSSANLQPSCPPFLPTPDPQVMFGHPLRYDSVARTSYEARSRTTTQRTETPLHGDNDVIIMDSVGTENFAKSPEEKRFSLMSLDIKLDTNTEQGQSRPTPAAAFLSPTSVPDDGFNSFFYEYVDPDNH